MCSLRQRRTPGIKRCFLRTVIGCRAYHPDLLLYFSDYLLADDAARGCGLWKFSCFARNCCGMRLGVPAGWYQTSTTVSTNKLEGFLALYGESLPSVILYRRAVCVKMSVIKTSSQRKMNRHRSHWIWSYVEQTAWVSTARWLRFSSAWKCSASSLPGFLGYCLPLWRRLPY